MKVTIYDKNPGPGFLQWCLKTSWLLGCMFQKLVGAVDDYHGASSWEDAKTWLLSRGPLTSIQYWGHGSPGVIWLNDKAIPIREWLALKPVLSPNSILWFRVCSAFQGKVGQEFSRLLANNLGCTIAGHTRVIGIWQGGLYTRTPFSSASWSAEEGENPKWREDLSPWLKHTIICLRTSVPKDW